MLSRAGSGGGVARVHAGPSRFILTGAGFIAGERRYRSMATGLIVSGLLLDAVGALLALWPEIEPGAGTWGKLGGGATRKRVGAGMLATGFVLQACAALL
jgi:hypothetical protein